MSCGSIYKVSYNYATVEKKIIAHALRCKSWDCSYCRLSKALKVQKFISRSFQNDRCWAFTFTFYHSDSPKISWALVGKRWNHFSTIIRQNYRNIRYIRILEPHKNSPYPHLHCIFNSPLNSKHLSAWLAQAGFGWNMHSTPLSSERYASYMSKYMTKEWPDENTRELRRIAHCRVVSSSRILGPIFSSKTDWHSTCRGVTKNAAAIIATTLANNFIKREHFKMTVSSRPDSLLYGLQPLPDTEEMIGLRSTFYFPGDGWQPQNLTIRNTQTQLDLFGGKSYTEAFCTAFKYVNA